MLSFILADLLKMIPYGMFIMFLIGLMWWAYVLYDTQICTDAINNNHRVPLFLNRVKLY
ncbi:hypothetical protein [Candidatus Methanosphaera massiliense]|jgi:hypothetical protein|uniref:hypothetical protein n=1 Tax=Methanosphaera TaxID=2316 RepID=UPI00237FD79F|nr:hypothetical protein [Candidatus Methanosphaera massiliense]MDD6285314.1 hypothetical protein [Methanobacteriaceae archaeon]MDE4078208.1 hypothetical protein [Candidatus Methanosphaera massiliense]MDY2745245.1 hypothetical protein [Methanosphaera sp.]